MSKVLLVSVGLSGNPDAETVPSKDGINGQVNRASDGAGYIVLRMLDNSNPFKQSKATRTYRQQKNSAGEWAWPGISPKEWKSLEGKNIPGSFVTLSVETYQIDGRDVNTYTTFVAPHESAIQVFKAAGHEVVGIETPEAVAVEAE